MKRCGKNGKCVKCNAGYLCDMIHLSGKHNNDLCDNCTKEMFRIFKPLEPMTYQERTNIAKQFKRRETCN